MCPPVSEFLRELRQWRLPALSQALAELSSFREQAQLMYLYRHFFPTAYAGSTAGCGRVDKGYSPREREFLSLVEEHLFPLDLDWLELWEGEAAGALIPPIVNPSYFEVDFEELSLTVRVLVALLAVNDAEPWTELCAQIGHRAPVPLTADGVSKIDWERFTNLCNSRHSPLAHVPLALDVIAHATGNFWLDLDENSLGNDRFEWDVSSLDFLASEWRQAQPLIQQYEQSLAWLEAHRSALATLIRLWNRAVER